MYNAILYKQANSMQRRDAKEVLGEFSHMIDWREDQHDSLLDIGCGSGDVLMDFILPILPESFDRLVGADSSKPMIEYCQRKYSHAKVSFEMFDVGLMAQQNIHNSEPFDHITSFYCLHWEQNQMRAIKNMYKLLKPGGDMLLAFLAQNPIYDIYLELANDPKWAKYMTDVHRYISPYHQSKDPVEDVRKLLISCGFPENTIELRDKSYVFEGVDALYTAVKAVNPFYRRIRTRELQDAYFEDYLNIVVRKGFASENDVETNRKTCAIRSTYKLMIVYAKRMDY